MGNLVDLLILPSDREIIDPNGSASISIPLAALDPSHPEIPGFLKNEILKQRHYHNFIADGVSTGHLKLVKEAFRDAAYKFTSKLPLPSFAGFVFEAFTIRALNYNLDMRGRAIAWSSNRRNVGKGFASKFKAIGTGLPETKTKYANLYAPQDPMDVKFVQERYHKITREYYFDILEIMGTNLPAGIQVKAITGSEKSEIIEPILSGRYFRVLTYLRHADGLHSYYECMRILENMHKAGEIGLEERMRVADAIKSPELLGISQSVVDDYYGYIKHAHRGMIDGDDLVWQGAELEIKFHKGGGGILVPDTLGESD